MHIAGQEAFSYMLSLVHDLQNVLNETEARSALRAFIYVRRLYQLTYLDIREGDSISSEELLDAIEKFVDEDSEGGKQAQAVVAALIEIFAGAERVESGRINDPSRKYPGDVCIAYTDDTRKWEKAIEVRDKPVSDSDVRIFGKKCVDMGVREAALVVVSNAQKI